MTRQSSGYVVAVAAGALLLAVSCSVDGGGSAKSTVAPTTAATPAKVVVPDQLGPHPVGRRTITVVDESRKRTLNVDVWYPADAESAKAAPLTRYVFLPTAYVDSATARDKPTVSSEGPFPLVAYSHGNGGISYVASFNMEHLASYGFIVASPDHLGNTAVESVLGSSDTEPVVAMNRPPDISAVITEMMKLSADPTNPFHGAVDAERIGVMGHSFGGFTSLAVAGGFTGTTGEIAADPRIKAVIGLAPYTVLLSDANLAAIKVPTLLMVGDKDVTTPIDNDTTRPWEKITATPIFRVDMVGAGHQSLTDVCDYQKSIPKLPDPPKVVVDFVNRLAEEGCGPGFMEHARAKDLVNIYTTAFLDTYVAGHDTYAGVLTDAYAKESTDIRYQSRPGS